MDIYFAWTLVVYMHLINYLCWLHIDAALSLSSDVHTHFLPHWSVVNIITLHVHCSCSD